MDSIVILCYPYWQYTDHFIFRFQSLLCLRSTLRLLRYSIISPLVLIFEISQLVRIYNNTIKNIVLRRSCWNYKSITFIYTINIVFLTPLTWMLAYRQLYRAKLYLKYQFPSSSISSSPNFLGSEMIAVLINFNLENDLSHSTWVMDNVKNGWWTILSLNSTAYSELYIVYHYRQCTTLSTLYCSSYTDVKLYKHT